MKIENLAFSLVVVFVAIVILAILGWGFSFVWANNLTLKESTGNDDVALFVARAVIGILFMGMMNGLYKLWDLFSFCMKSAPTDNNQ